jgi:hypothetical protein
MRKSKELNDIGKELALGCLKMLTIEYIHMTKDLVAQPT